MAATRGPLVAASLRPRPTVPGRRSGARRGETGPPAAGGHTASPAAQGQRAAARGRVPGQRTWAHVARPGTLGPVLLRAEPAPGRQTNACSGGPADRRIDACGLSRGGGSPALEHMERDGARKEGEREAGRERGRERGRGRGRGRGGQREAEARPTRDSSRRSRTLCGGVGLGGQAPPPCRAPRPRSPTYWLRRTASARLA